MLKKNFPKFMQFLDSELALQKSTRTIILPRTFYVSRQYYSFETFRRRNSNISPLFCSLGLCNDVR